VFYSKTINVIIIDQEIHRKLLIIAGYYVYNSLTIITKAAYFSGKAVNACRISYQLFSIDKTLST